jgi:hypothetical protein
MMTFIAAKPSCARENCLSLDHRPGSRLVPPDRAVAGKLIMLTIVLTDEERVLLLDALECILEMSPIRPDPNAPLAERLMTRLRDSGNAVDDQAG